MYELITNAAAGCNRVRWQCGLVGALALLVAACSAAIADAQGFTAGAEFTSPNIIRHISRQSERLEVTSNSSRILTLDMSIPRVQVNNPELVKVTPLSATEIQVSAMKPGVTQINLWDTDQKVHTIDVIIYGDVRELEFALKTQFPNSTVKVKKFSESLMLTGFVDSPDHVSPIMRLAEDYAPKVINNLNVGGVQQVLLKTKIFEVSRTKLRQLGVDWALSGDGGEFAVNGISGLINATSITNATSVNATGATFTFGLVDGATQFFGALEALQDNSIAKILAEPNIVSVSGRPAQFLEGGEVPVLVPQGNNTVSIEYKPFGTQVDFLPIVLGNGNIRLEVRPRVSDIDETLGVIVQNNVIPGFRVRQADTAVELKAGQTFALAGLIQQRTTTSTRGLPFISDIPVIGTPFRRTRDEVEEIELLFLVTPEFVDALDPHQVPQCGPGQSSMSPDNCSLYFGGNVEVPNAYGPCAENGGCASGNCGTGAGYGGANCDGCTSGVPMDGYSQPYGTAEPSFAPSPSGMEYNESYEATPEQYPAGPEPVEGEPIHGELNMPEGSSAQSGYGIGPGQYRQAMRQSSVHGGYSTPHQGVYRRGDSTAQPPAGSAAGGGLIGPVGYDVE